MISAGGRRPSCFEVKDLTPPSVFAALRALADVRQSTATMTYPDCFIARAKAVPSRPAPITETEVLESLTDLPSKAFWCMGTKFDRYRATDV
jgi:hypothetical protein